MKAYRRSASRGDVRLYLAWRAQELTCFCVALFASACRTAPTQTNLLLDVELAQPLTSQVNRVGVYGEPWQSMPDPASEKSSDAVAMQDGNVPPFVLTPGPGKSELQALIIAWHDDQPIAWAVFRSAYASGADRFLTIKLGCDGGHDLGLQSGDSVATTTTIDACKFSAPSPATDAGNPNDGGVAGRAPAADGGAGFSAGAGGVSGVAPRAGAGAGASGPGAADGGAGVAGQAGTSAVVAGAGSAAGAGGGGSSGAGAGGDAGSLAEAGSGGSSAAGAGGNAGSLAEAGGGGSSAAGAGGDAGSLAEAGGGGSSAAGASGNAGSGGSAGAGGSASDCYKWVTVQVGSADFMTTLMQGFIAAYDAIASQPPASVPNYVCLASGSSFSGTQVGKGSQWGCYVAVSETVEDTEMSFQLLEAPSDSSCLTWRSLDTSVNPPPNNLKYQGLPLPTPICRVQHDGVGNGSNSSGKRVGQLRQVAGVWVCRFEFYFADTHQTFTNEAGQVVEVLDLAP